MTKMMNSGHSRLSQWGFSNISVNPDAEVLDVGCGGGANIAVWLSKCRNGHVTGLDYSEVSVSESRKLNAAAIQRENARLFREMYLPSHFQMQNLIISQLLRRFTSGQN